MVAPLTDPAWTPLFMAADGVVVNVGGQISHAIIVSRELWAAVCCVCNRRHCAYPRRGNDSCPTAAPAKVTIIALL